MLYSFEVPVMDAESSFGSLALRFVAPRSGAALRQEGPGLCDLRCSRKWPGEHVPRPLGLKCACARLDDIAGKECYARACA